MTSVQSAIQLFEAGKYDEAEHACRTVLAGAPGDADALHILALARQRLGAAGEAAELLRKVLDAQPGNPAVAYNLAVALHEAGDLDAAIRTYKAVLKTAPDDVDVHYNLGIAYNAQGKRDLAVQSYRRALKLAPDLAKAHNNLANTLRDQGKLQAALESYRAACRSDPASAEAHVNLAVVAAELGESEEATLHFGLAIDIRPRSDAASYALARGLAESGRAADAVPVLMHLLAQSPEMEAAWTLFATLPDQVASLPCDDGTSALLTQLLDRPSVAPADVASPIAAYLRNCDDVTAAMAKPDGEAAVSLSANGLLCRLMALTTVPDEELEKLFVSLRRVMLEAMAEGTLPDGALPFAVALARQAFLCEYVFDVTEEELAAARALDLSQPANLAMAAAYVPLHALGRDGEIVEAHGDGPLADLIRQQIMEPAAERALTQDIPVLTGMATDGVSAAVQNQYEENPYPRWSKAALVRGGGTVADMLSTPPFGFDVRTSPKDDWRRVLIAGCGTGQHAVMAAARFPDADILAVDLSRASLAYAARKAGELGILNIRFAQADILGFKDLDGTYDVIESVGVLHHMEEPGRGWACLVSCLRPGGLMKVGLYSEAARRDIAAVSVRLKAEGFAPTLDGMRSARAFVRAQADTGDEDMRSVSATSDFFSASECRDMLFHAQEHRMTIPWIKAQLDRMGLHFLGFEIRDEDVRRAFKKAFPSPKAVRSLTDWAAFENEHPAAFREMYQFWCQKK